MYCFSEVESVSLDRVEILHTILVQDRLGDLSVETIC